MATPYKVNDVDYIFVIGGGGGGGGSLAVSDNGIPVSVAASLLNFVGELDAVVDAVVPGQVNIGTVYRIFGGTGVAGDTIVFDSTLTPAGSAPGFRALKNGGFDGNTAFIVGWARTAFVGNGDSVPVSRGGIMLPADTGLTGADAGQLTVDYTSGLIVPLTDGDTQYGLCDGNGNAFMLQVAQFPVGL